MPLTPFDDYPLHQTPLPVAHPASGDPNVYDRYFFNGFRAGGDLYIGAAMGLYPNRRVIDAAFSVVKDGVQRSVYASGPAPLDPGQTRVGPIGIEVVVPLRESRLRVEAAHHGIEADLLWRPRTVAVEEPRQTLRQGTVTMLDTTRLTQWGTWEGTISVDGERIDVDPSDVRGTKDRSWGVRPVGEPAPAAPNPDARLGIFFLWNPVHFEDRCTLALLFEAPDGARLAQSSLSVPILGDGDPVFGVDHVVRHGHAPRYGIDWRPGTRRSRAATMEFDYPDGGGERLSLEPILDFQMKGIGYVHPQWGHGRWHGGPAEGTETWKLDELDPLQIPNLHVQQLCRVTDADGRDGIGVLEQLPMGPHAPTGLKEYFDAGA